MTRACFSLAAVWLLFAPSRAPAWQDGWNGIRSLDSGAECRVWLAGGKRIEGRLASSTADSLTVSRQTVSKKNVLRVAVKRPGHHGRNALIGLAGGAVAGVAIGASVDNASGGDFANLGKMVFTPLGAIVGAVVGAVIPSGGWHTVYRAP